MTVRHGPRVLRINEADNVVVALEDIPLGTGVRGPNGETIRVRNDIAFGHKIALADIDEGAYIIKYGAHIGVATKSIAAGEHVHVHNVRDIVDEVRARARGRAKGQL